MRTNAWPNLMRLSLLIASSLLIMAAFGCSGGVSTSPTDLDLKPQPQAAQPDSLASVPFPRQASAIDDVELFKPVREGSDYSADLANGKIATDGALATFQPVSGADLGSLAYCIYRLRCYRESETTELHFTWDGDAPVSGTCWVGLPDWEGQGWTWNELPEDNMLSLDAATFASDNHTSYVAVIVTGEDEPVLEQVECVCSPDGVEDFILFSPILGTTTYLMRNDGEIVHTWDADYPVKYSVYLIDDRYLLRTNANSDGKDDGKIELVDWDGTILWSYDDFAANLIMHHDIDRLPNGNVIALCFELWPDDEAIAAGMNPAFIPEDTMQVDSIVEIMPTGPDTGEVVWEWYLSDHLVQDFDDTKDNYGVIAETPGRLNVNVWGSPRVDFVHANAIDYNAELDQIAMSWRSTCEVYIIDHSTTTEEAATSSGGTHGVGGDFMYRWGNPQIYGQGTENDQQLFFQHDVEWIGKGLPGEGHLLIYNNQVPGPDTSKHSTVVEIVTPIALDKSYLIDDGSYGPVSPVWTYEADPPESFYSTAVSSAQRLANGNTVICAGIPGRFFEVTAAGEIVWDHQNELPAPETPQTFRCDRVYLFSPWYDYNQLSE